MLIRPSSFRALVQRCRAIGILPRLVGSKTQLVKR